MYGLILGEMLLVGHGDFNHKRQCILLAITLIETVS